MRIAELVKTYKLLSDPEAPSWSVKFVGATAGAVLLVAGVVAIGFAAQDRDARDANVFAAAATTTGADGARTDYVGYDPTVFDAKLGYDAERVEAALAAWKASHRDVRMLSTEPVWSGDRIIGYNVRYMP